MICWTIDCTKVMKKNRVRLLFVENNQYGCTRIYYDMTNFYYFKILSVQMGEVVALFLKFIFMFQVANFWYRSIFLKFHLKVNFFLSFFVSKNKFSLFLWKKWEWKRKRKSSAIREMCQDKCTPNPIHRSNLWNIEVGKVRLCAEIKEMENV